MRSGVKQGARMLGVGAVLLMAAGVTPAIAQEANSGASDQGGLDTIVVTATKRQESLQDVGVSVSALGGDEIDRVNPGDSTELFQKVPSLEFQSNAGSTNANIFLRGVGSTGISFNLQSGVGVYADEVVLNSPVVNILQVYDLERVEVLRGPQNTLYGRNTTGGAINFISRKPEVGGPANGYLQGTYGRFDQIDLNAAIGAPLGEIAAFRAAVQYQTRDGIRNNLVTGNKDFDRDKFAARAQLAIEPSDVLSLNVKGHIERVRGGNLRYKTIGGFDPANLAAPCPTPDTLGACAASTGFQDTDNPREIFSDLVDARNDVNSGGVSATANLDFEQFSITSITAYEENSQVLSEDTDATPAAGFHFFLDNNQQQFSQEIRLTSASDKDFRWILGGYFFNEQLKGATGPLFATPMGTMLVQSFAKYDNTTYSGYGDFEYDLTDRLTFKGGVRYSSDNIEGQMAALLALQGSLPGVDLNNSLLGGNPLPSFSELTSIATANGVPVFTGGAVGAGPQRLIFVGGDSDPTAQVNDTTFNNWGGKAGLDFKAADGVLIYAQWSRGFKAGRFNNAPMSIQNLDAVTGRSFGDTPLRPERVNAYEIGLKTEFADRRARINAAIFYNDYTDQQINQFIAGEFTVVNADSKIFGGEIEMNLAPGGGFFVDAGASFLSTDVDNPTSSPLLGEHLPLAPDFTFNMAARKEWELSNGSILTLGVDGNYVSDRFFDLANVTMDDSYFIANAQASYEFGGEGRYRLSLWGKNIFNENYFQNRFLDGSQVGPDTVILSEPATYGVTLRAEF